MKTGLFALMTVVTCLTIVFGIGSRYDPGLIWDAVIDHKAVDLSAVPISIAQVAPVWEMDVPLCWRDADGDRRVHIGENGLLAIEDRGRTKLFDPTGRSPGVYGGVPVGFLTAGRLVVVTDSDHVRSILPGGAVDWEVSPRVAVERHLSRNGTSVIEMDISDFGCGSGSVWVVVQVGSGSDERLDKVVWYDEDGILIGVLNAGAGNPVSTARGTLLMPVEAVDGLVTYLEYDGAGRRLSALRVAALELVAVGVDGRLLAADSRDPARFTVYEPDGMAGVAFELPPGMTAVSAGANGYVYAVAVEPGQIVVSAWQWPNTN